jgi:hypothetical protein
MLCDLGSFKECKVKEKEDVTDYLEELGNTASFHPGLG